MMRRVKVLIALIMTIVMSLSLFTGCKAKPTPEDAQNYVRAILDIICTGDHDHTVELVDIEEGKEGEFREDILDEIMTAVTKEQELSDELKEEYRNFFKAAYEKCKYTVGDATELEEGGYDVNVSIEPLKIFDTLDNGEFEKELEKKVMADPDKFLAMSESEQTEYGFKFLVDKLNEDLENPKYGDPVDVTVRYELLDEKENVYGCTEEEGEKLGEHLFDFGSL